MPKTSTAMRTAAKKSPAKAAQPTTPQLPKWLSDPNPESMYQLSFRGEDCSCEPLIELTRSEFVALRTRLAELRSYAVVQEAHNA